MNEQDLRAKIASRVRTGLLPSERPAKTYAGIGEGASCDCCGLVITDRDVQYEVDFAISSESSRRTLIAHRDCHRIWQRLVDPAIAKKRGGQNSNMVSPGF